MSKNTMMTLASLKLIFRQVLSGRSIGSKLAVQNDSTDEKQDDLDDGPQLTIRSSERHPRGDHQCGKQNWEQSVKLQQRPPREGIDVCCQVSNQRQHPQQRHRCDVCCDASRDCQHHGRRASGAHRGCSHAAVLLLLPRRWKRRGADQAGSGPGRGGAGRGKRIA